MLHTLIKIKRSTKQSLVHTHTRQRFFFHFSCDEITFGREMLKFETLNLADNFMAG